MSNVLVFQAFHPIIFRIIPGPLTGKKYLAMSSVMNGLAVRAIQNTVKSVSAAAEFPGLQKNGPANDFRSGKLIATHNGVFHADEALACFLLVQLPNIKTQLYLGRLD